MQTTTAAVVSYAVQIPEIWFEVAFSGSRYWMAERPSPERSASGKILPHRWSVKDEGSEEHSVDLVEAYTRACVRWGADWFDSPGSDANRYDVAVQLAAFGEVRYG